MLGLFHSSGYHGANPEANSWVLMEFELPTKYEVALLASVITAVRRFVLEFPPGGRQHEGLKWSYHFCLWQAS